MFHLSFVMTYHLPRWALTRIISPILAEKFEKHNSFLLLRIEEARAFLSFQPAYDVM
jgi:hypothetical protein